MEVGHVVFTHKLVVVSILLGQWITLEDIVVRHSGELLQGFNPSGSMDYFGSPENEDVLLLIASFQSFWVNGLLWKTIAILALSPPIVVSILLGQWITLEVPIITFPLPLSLCFNPSGSMDYFGRRRKH